MRMTRTVMMMVTGVLSEDAAEDGDVDVLMPAKI
jgi:hypothetical protein